MNSSSENSESIEFHPSSAREIFQQGVAARSRGDLMAARVYFERAIDLQPNFVAAYNNLANLLQQTGEIATAIEVYESALQLAPNLAVLHCNLASLWQIQGDIDRAISGYQRAIDLQPDFVVAHHNLAKLLVAQGQFAPAIRSYQYSLRLNPQAGEVHLDLGNLYRQLGSIGQAIECYRLAARFLPQSAQAYNHLGAALSMWGETKIARLAYQKAIALNSNYDAAYFNLGQLLEGTGQLTAAAKHYERALELQPQATSGLYHLNYLRLKLADWDNYANRLNELIISTREYLDRDPALSPPPLVLSAFPVPLSLQRQVAENYAKSQAKMVRELEEYLPPRTLDRAPGRLKIGYVSPDFRTHAVGKLIQEIFAYHQRPDFEIFAYSLVPVVDDLTKKIQQGCDRFVDVSYRSPLEIATQIRYDGIDILIDLAGYTTNSCTPLFALQPAPIQIQYLGYPGTMGADFIQYIVADKQLIPPELTKYYREEVIYLPQVWVASRMEISDPQTSRADWGLPAEGIVFCCFNGTYKIDPTVFAAWMQILQGVPDSVLWLADGGQSIIRNRLRQRAIDLGVNPDRLVFAATNLPYAEYLARYRLADLFLDTFIYNAGSTAVDALQSGMPVLTCPGESYAARMGASLCAAIGLPELICSSPHVYVEKAIELGNHPDQIQALKTKLAEALPLSPLFQPQTFMRNFEAALRQIWEKYSIK